MPYSDMILCWQVVAFPTPVSNGLYNKRIREHATDGTHNRSHRKPPGSLCTTSRYELLDTGPVYQLPDTAQVSHDTCIVPLPAQLTTYVRTGFVYHLGQVMRIGPLIRQGKLGCTCMDSITYNGSIKRPSQNTYLFEY